MPAATTTARCGALDVRPGPGSTISPRARSDDPGPLTWPEGNGWISKRLLERASADSCTPAAWYIGSRRRARSGASLTPAVAWTADAVIFAAPSFCASRTRRGRTADAGLDATPWVTANLTLDRWPVEQRHRRRLGQRASSTPRPRLRRRDAPDAADLRAADRVTYYWALADGTPRANWQWLPGAGLGDAERSHPGRPVARPSGHPRLREPDRHLPHGARDDPSDARLSCPLPGISSRAAKRRTLSTRTRPERPLDLPRRPQHRGVIAAESAAARVGRRGQTLASRTSHP